MTINRSDFVNNRNLFGILKSPLYFFGGMLFSFPYTGGSFSPFAAAFSAASDGFYSVCAALGSITGFFIFHSGLTAFRYFAISLTTAATLNIALRAFGFEKENLLKIICPAGCCFIVNLIFLISQKISADLIFSMLCETALCGAAVPVFSEALKQLRDKSLLHSGTEKDKAFICLALSLSLASAHLRCAGAVGEGICCFIFFFMILALSQIKGFEGGVIAGICCSFVFAMNGEADFTCVIFSLCGCICSFFPIRKRIIRAAIAVGSAVFGFTLGEYTDFFPIVPAAAAAGIVYCVIPQKFMYNRDENRCEEINLSAQNNIKTNEIASAVERLSDCVTAVRKTLEPYSARFLKNALCSTAEKVCSECELCESCINEIKNPDNPCFDKLAEDFESGEPEAVRFPEKFSATCCHSKKMLEEMKKSYFIHCTEITANRKINRMQTLAGNQFRTFGGIIGQACEAAGTAVIDSRYDSASAASAEEFGVEIKDARLCTDKAGREYFDISFLKPKNNFSVTDLTEKLCTDTGYELDFPTLVQNGNVYDLIFRQKEKLTFNIAAAVRPASGKNVCGDYYRCFKDTFSRRVVLLSDGMGTGSRAAVDSAFTCETFCNLIKSGLDEKTAAAAVNCAMMVKSTDESLSTVDFLRLDPVLKTAEIFKCGAAPSFILKNKKISVIETESTPIGILDSVNMSVSRFEIGAGDIIILASDGVTGDRFNWLCNELKSYSGSDATELAKLLLQCAADRKIGKRADDMTVIAVCVADI